MARRVILHVGAMKSGSSYLQALMMDNRDLLRERGVLLPGEVWRDQVGGVAEVLERKRVATPPEPGAWQRLVDEMAAWDDIGLISMEFLGPIGQKKIERVVSSFPAGTVEVVIAARDLNRNVPAMWQESVKNGSSATFAEYVEMVRIDDGAGSVFWREQTIGAMCSRWSEIIGADRVTLVTVPRPGAPTNELWRRFSAAIGIDGEGVTPPAAANESLGAVSVELVRELNGRLTDLDFEHYAPVMKHRLAKFVLGARRAEEPAVGFAVPPWLPSVTDQMIARIQHLGIRVVGDLADLRPVAVPGVDPAKIDPELKLGAALDGLEHLVRVLSKRHARDMRQGR